MQTDHPSASAERRSKPAHDHVVPDELPTVTTSSLLTPVQLVISLVLGLCLLPMLWPLVTAIKHVPDHGTELAGSSAVVARTWQAMADTSGCSVASSGSDLLLYLLTISSVAVLAWRFTLRHRRTHR